MIVDTSAILAVVLLEAEANVFTRVLRASAGSKLSAAAYLEAGLKLIELGFEEPWIDLDETVEGLALVVVPVDRTQARVAVEARLRYGKGRHPAGLNYGDCFAYALAKVTGEPLLYKGGDFALTDVVSAL